MTEPAIKKQVTEQVKSNCTRQFQDLVRQSVKGCTIKKNIPLNQSGVGAVKTVSASLTTIRLYRDLLYTSGKPLWPRPPRPVIGWWDCQFSQVFVKTRYVTG